MGIVYCLEIHRVTVTGADDMTDLTWMQRMSEKHTRLEWGILVNGDDSGRERFPSKAWLRDLRFHMDKWPQTRASLHVCGAMARDFLDGQREAFLREYGYLVEGSFSRLQLNFGTCDTPLSRDFEKILEATSSRLDVDIILQTHRNSRHSNRFQDICRSHPRIVCFHDSSGGRGEGFWRSGGPRDDCLVYIPKPCPSQTGQTGYGGGIGPYNVRDAIASMWEAFQRCDSDTQPLWDTIWIDSESGVRARDNETGRSYLVPSMVESLLDAVYGMEIVDLDGFGRRIGRSSVQAVRKSMETSS